MVLVGAFLIDGTGAEPVRGRAVVVQDGRIVEVVDESRAPRGHRIDLAGGIISRRWGTCGSCLHEVR